MNRTPKNPAEHDMHDPLDQALHKHFHQLPEPADEGFSERVLAALPPQQRRGRVAWVEWAQGARWAAMSLAAVCVALLHAQGGGMDAAHQAGAYALLGLLVFWSLPMPWSRA